MLFPALSASGQRAPASTQGSYTIAVSTRSFDAPLFGGNTSTTFHIFGHQVLKNGIDVSGYAYAGFPNTTTYVGVQFDRIRIWDGIATIDAGDFSAVRVQPEGLAMPSSDTFALDGVQLRWLHGDDRGFSLFAGLSKFLLALPGAPTRRPFLAGGEYFLRRDRDYFDAGLTLIDHPVYSDPSIHRDADAIARFSYLRRVSPLALLFADAYAGRGAGFRAGATVESQLAQATASVYSFGREFPLLSSFNPGERGIQASGSYRPAELSSLSSQVFYVVSDTGGGRRDIRGEISYGQGFGTDAPYVFLSYAREQLTVDSSDQNVSGIADRFSVAATRAWLSGYSSLQLDRVMNRRDATPDTTQLLATQHQVLGSASFLDATFLVQSEHGRWGATLESSVETPWRGPYYILSGIGAAYVASSTMSGEGVLRIGVTRRVLSNGPYGRLEVRIPVSIGLTRSHLNRNLVSLDIGTRFGSQDLRNIQSIFAPILTPNQFGSIAGRVSLDGEGVAGVVILLNGEPASQTDRAGTFRIGRVGVGSANIAVDVAQLEPGLSVVGEPARDVLVQPREPTNVDFAIARFTTLRGSFVICENDRPKPVAGARLALVKGNVVIPVEVSQSGGFQVDQVPPGEYDIVIDPTSVPGIPAAAIPRLHVDLRQDLLGFVIGIHCPSTITSRARPSTTPPPPSMQPEPAPAPAPVAVVESAPVPVLPPTPQLEPVPLPLPAPAKTAEQQPISGRAATLERAASLVREERFVKALSVFEQAVPITETKLRYFYAVALYETGRYADAKREIVAAEIPDTSDAMRYVAKIEGAITP